MSFSRLNNESNKIMTSYVIGSTRNILLGAGLSYAIEKKFYIHIPIIFIMPSVYAGYHMFKNRDAIINWLI
jgi:hypothetical protein